MPALTTMKSYFDLIPRDVLHEVFAEWITTSDLARLDSAVCNYAHRTQFMEIIQESYFTTEGVDPKYLTNRYFEWIVLRNLQVRSLNLNFDQIDQFMFVIQLGCYLKKIKNFSASFVSTVTTSCSITILNKCCKSLESLDFSSSANPLTDFELWAILRCSPEFPGLKTLNFSNCCQVSEFALQQLFMKCPNLQTISLANMVKLQNSTIQLMLKYCPKLQHIDLSNCISLTDATLHALTDYGNSLQSISLTNGINYSAEDLQAFLSSKVAAPLKVINLEGCAAVNDKVLYTIGDLMIALEEVSISGCPFVTIAGVEKVTYSCVQLRKIAMNDCPLVLKDKVLDMLHYCKQLQHVEAKHCEVDFKCFV